MELHLGFLEDSSLSILVFAFKKKYYKHFYDNSFELLSVLASFYTKHKAAFMSMECSNVPFY